MLNKYLRFSHNPIIDGVIKVALSTLLLIMGGSVVITKELNVPVTLQSLLVLLPAVWFGWKIGTTSVVLYIVAGITGLPVFAGGTSGIDRVFNQSSGGFFWGFVLAAIICGYIAEMVKPQHQLKSIGIWFLGHVIILSSGIFWIMRYSEGYMDIIKSTAPGLALKSAIGYFLTQVVFRLLVPRDIYYQK